MALGSPQQRELLAVLLLHRDQQVSSDRLIDALWGEQAPPSAIKIVQGYVSNLRKALGDGMLVTRGHGYALHVQPGQIDVDRFESLVTEGRRALGEGDARSAVARLRGALGLWRGPPLADFAYEQFAQGEIARLEEAHLGAREDCIDAELMLGRHRGVVGELELLVGQHPHRERLLGQLMLALYRAGRQADALAAYRRGRESLGEELGLEPGPQLRALEQRILTHDPALDAPAPTATVTQGAPKRVAYSRSLRAHKLLAAGGALLLAAAIAAAIGELAGGASIGLRAAANSVAAIDTRSNRVVAQVAVGARPSAITSGSGSLWVANLDDQNISRVDPQTLRTVQAVPVGAPPTAIAAARERMWVVASNPSRPFVSVRAIDPQFDTIGSPTRISTVVTGDQGALAARGDTLWVAPSSGELTRLDPVTGSTIAHLDPNGGPTGIGVGADAVWVSDSEANNVIRVDSTGVVNPIPVGNGPSGIAAGNGGVWVADTLDDAVVRIDPSTRAVKMTIPVGRSPAGVAIGAGSVWVANSGDGTVTRIDPKTDKTTTIAVGGSPQAITVVGDRAWVTVDAQTIPPTGVAAGGGSARLDSQFDVGPMDPALAGPLASPLLYATCAKLLNYPDKPGLAGSRLVPEVAQSLPTRSTDGKTYTFTIRQGFRFSPPSTEAVTAQTFKDTIERTLNPAMKIPNASDFADIIGARAYMAGKTAHIAGVIARGNTFTIRLTAPAPSLLARVAEPAFCAVPSDTPIDPKGVRGIPSAGPYRVASETPGQGVVLTRNPNYHGSRPHRLARIELVVGIPPHRAVAQVQAGTADYAVAGEVTSADNATLAARYGPGSAAAKSGHQQYFVGPGPQLDFLALNTHRPLFADARLRRAVNYAIDRTTLARLGDAFVPLPEQPIDHYLPPGIPGYRKLRIYPLRPDLAKARQLANGHAHATAVLYTCDVSPCDQEAQIIKTDLAAIGVGVEIKVFHSDTYFTKLATPGEPFDIAWDGWLPYYQDPAGMLNALLEDGTAIPTFKDPAYRERLAAAARLSGAERYLTYARLDADLARNAAPLVALGELSSPELFFTRMGCQTYGVYDIDLAALCIKKSTP